ncbi:NHLP family bacteriocin export ABC transporter peptidase/permease/ATPase subunit [Frankia sp. CcI49]|uniref:NHLP family bacteriocin export ABC transporter peptidase/permease/ATPase subunit n=1 Tax=Frankia sp. CcI49 TaxID=1745382 RepID=UPI001F5187AF|nr:NHLP family bacteriocin export ABC transporter peptidase/permease/ATPase subunit [Frankia sp. CcI49]
MRPPWRAVRLPWRGARGVRLPWRGAADAERRDRPRRRRVHTPTVIQMEAVECGAASLGIILGYFGRFIPLERLRETCGVSRDGSTASSVLKAGRQHGLIAKGFRMDLPQLATARLPAILFWKFEHFVVLEGMSRRKVYINDPATGPRALGWDEFDASFTGVILTFEPGPDFARTSRPESTLHKLLARWRGLGSVTPQILLLGLLVALVGLTTSMFTRMFVDRVLLAGDSGAVVGLVAAMGAAVGLTLVASTLQQRLLLRADSVLALSSAARFFRRLLRLPVAFFSQRQAADLGQRVRVNNVVADMLTRHVAVSVVDTVLVLTYGALLCWYDLLLGAIALGFSGLNVVVLRWTARRRTSAVAGLQAERGKLITAAYTSILMIESVKAAGEEEHAFRRFAARQAAVLSGQQKLGVPTAVISVVPALLAALNTALLLGLGSSRVSAGTITIGLLVAMQGLIAAMNRPISELAGLATRLENMSADLNRVHDVERYPDPAGRAHTGPWGRMSGHLRLENLTFGYNPLAEPLLRDFSLDIAPGRRVALVGASGSGKSTVGRIVAGLFAPWSGSVTIDGRTVNDTDAQLWASSVALVDQDQVFFDDSIRNNLTLWDGTITDEELAEALRDACVYDTVTARPGGLAAPVREGGKNFSGGQRQRLEIARALVRRPSLLVLDEATSALDPATELVVDHNLRRRGSTCLIVAHRLSTIRDSDLIVVLDRGREIERGTHSDLMARGGHYAGLVRQQ